MGIFWVCGDCFTNPSLISLRSFILSFIHSEILGRSVCDLIQASDEDLQELQEFLKNRLSKPFSKRWGGGEE